MAGVNKVGGTASQRAGALTGTGVWCRALRYAAHAEAAEAAAELEELGYSGTWIPGGTGGPVLPAVSAVLDGSRRMAVATGILSIYVHEPRTVAMHRAGFEECHPHRFVLGLGVSHARLVDAEAPGRYRRPLSAMAAYLDALDRVVPPVPATTRVLAALRPRMLRLARERAAGAHPYLVTPEHTHEARQIVGPERLLAPEQTVVLESDPVRARDIARAFLGTYLRLENYRNLWRSLGFSEDDMAAGGSRRLVDELVAWGDEDAIRAQVEAHREAGADHVCVQVLTEPADRLPRPEWRRLAAALLT